MEHISLPPIMNILIFKTDIETEQKLERVEPLFNNHPVILNWSVDTEDIDNVLRVEATQEAEERDIIYLVQACGFSCEELPG